MYYISDWTEKYIEVHTTLDVDFLSRLQIFISTSHIHLQIFIPITYLQLHICITYISRKLSILQDVYDSFKTMHSPISHMGLQQKLNTQFVAKHRNLSLKLGNLSRQQITMLEITLKARFEMWNCKKTRGALVRSYGLTRARDIPSQKPCFTPPHIFVF